MTIVLISLFLALSSIDSFLFLLSSCCPSFTLIPFFFASCCANSYLFACLPSDEEIFMLVVGSNLFAVTESDKRVTFFIAIWGIFLIDIKNRQQSILVQKCIEMFVWVYVLLPPSCLLALIFCLFSAFLSSAIVKTLFLRWVRRLHIVHLPWCVSRDWYVQSSSTGWWWWWWWRWWWWW